MLDTRFFDSTFAQQSLSAPYILLQRVAVKRRACPEQSYPRIAFSILAPALRFQTLSKIRPVRQATVIVSIVLPILAIAVAGLRFVARKARKLPLLADD